MEYCAEWMARSRAVEVDVALYTMPVRPKRETSVQVDGREGTAVGSITIMRSLDVRGVHTQSGDVDGEFEEYEEEEEEDVVFRRVLPLHMDRSTVLVHGLFGLGSRFAPQ